MAYLDIFTTCALLRQPSLNKNYFKSFQSGLLASAPIYVWFHYMNHKKLVNRVSTFMHL